MYSMLSSIDATVASEITQLLEGEIAARELLQGMVDKISGAPHVRTVIASLQDPPHPPPPTSPFILPIR